MSAIIDITTILSSDLKSRLAVSDLSLFIQNMNEKSVVVDFANVKFVTRSFIDEFYNVFLKNTTSSDIKISLVNVSEDIQMVFDAISRTQKKEKKVSEKSSVVKLSNFEQVNSYLNGLLI
ncbi:MAG: STAS-like domain-containing protein [Culturomica sp.]|jgi:anti-anti-sigma regulatory factor|nr:STAS-like domain-containing protein [Culturomica sp.]